MSLSFWICALITAGSAFTSLGFSITAYLSSNKDSRTNSMYAVSRSVALAAISIFPFFNHAATGLIAIATSMIIVQALDAFIGIKIHDKVKSFGPALTATINLVTLLWFIK
jgi:hypothetical protein